MRPSISVSLDPGLERGVPWGRDLYTFVTSAAGHMMRTLQKPRKSRPSKRQVNHRRFLHNMIQRKFADIEAANHRLASAIYLNDQEKNSASLSSDESGTTEQPATTSQTDEVCTGSGQVPPSTESHDKRQRQQEGQSFICNSEMNNRSENSQGEETDHKLAESAFPEGSEDRRGPEIFLFDSPGGDDTWKQMDSLPDDTPPPLKESSFRQFDQNADFSLCVSPELSPVAPDSYHFSIQAQTDKPSCPQAPRSLADFSEGQLNDIMDLFCAGSEDFGGCPDLETYFDRMCACQGGGGPETEVDDVNHADQSAGFGEDLACDESGPSCIHSCQEVQVPSPNRSRQQNLSSSELDPQEQFYNSGNAHHAPASYYGSTHLHTHTGEKSACMLATWNLSDLTPFEGIAQSFSAPPHHPENRLVPTPPHEDDWLFTDILKDGKSPDFP